MAAPVGPSLQQLIAAHQATRDAFNDLCTAEDEISSAYRAKYNDDPVMVPCFLGGGYSLNNDPVDIERWMREAYQRSREGLAKIAPDAAEPINAVLDAKEAENVKFIDRALEEEEMRKEAFGLAATERDYRAASEAEDAAIVAICAHVCRTPEEGQLKAKFLSDYFELMAELTDEQTEALLQSLAGGAYV
jgi:hypothetical protein